MEEINIGKYKYSFKDSAWGYFLAVLIPIAFQLLASVVFACVALKTGKTTTEILSISYVAAIYYSLSSLSLLIMFLVFNKVKKKKTFACAKINFKFGLLNLALCILLAVVVLFGFNYIINLLTYLMQLVGYNPDTSMPLPLNSVGWLFVNLFVLALLPAVCEEVIYRGIILNGLRSRGTHFAVLISALLFALAHGAAIQFLYQFVLGAVIGYVLIKTGSLIASMIVHFLNNAMVLVVNYISITNGLNLESTLTTWSAFDVVFAICMAIMAVGAIILILSFMKSKKPELIYEKNNEKPDSLTKVLFSIAVCISIIIWCLGTFL